MEPYVDGAGFCPAPCWGTAVVLVIVAVYLLVQWTREEPPDMKPEPGDLQLIEEAEDILQARGMTRDQAVEETVRLAESGLTAAEINEAARRRRYRIGRGKD